MNAHPLRSLVVAALIVLTGALASAGALQGEGGALFQSAIVSGDGPFAHPAGHIEGTGQTPEPESLYRAQLDERLAYGTPPDAPTRLTVHVDGAAAQLQWRHVAGNEVAFVIERAVDPGTFEEIARCDAGQTAWWDRDLPRETAAPQTRRYRVRAVDARGKSAWSNPVAIRLGSE